MKNKPFVRAVLGGTGSYSRATGTVTTKRPWCGTPQLCTLGTTNESTQDRGGSVVLMRAKVAMAAAGLVATGALVAGAQASGQPAGVVHLYEYAPPTAVPGRVILTGAIFDHGLDQGGAGPDHTYHKLVLTKGSFELDVGKIKVHQQLDKRSCTLVVLGSGPAPIVKGSGTGAYQGITGTSRAKTGFTGVFPKKANGTCNTSVPAETGFGWMSAVARFSLG
jgi:hypothetical protein